MMVGHTTVIVESMIPNLLVKSGNCCELVINCAGREVAAIVATLPRSTTLLLVQA